MKDKNGIELKHGDLVRVDFACLNASTCTCLCRIYNDKLEVVSGKEPKTYYTREITKIESAKENPTKEDYIVQAKYRGLKCNNESYEWQDDTITDEKMEQNKEIER